jgi:DNA-directed RNA polymerase specialized sigma54-like protein
MQGISWLAENLLASQETLLHVVSQLFKYKTNFMQKLQTQLQVKPNTAHVCAILKDFIHQT